MMRYLASHWCVCGNGLPDPTLSGATWVRLRGKTIHLYPHRQEH